MVKCRDNNMSLPYAMLISRFMTTCEMDLSMDLCMNLGLCHFFEKKKTMKRLNTHQVHDVGQNGKND